LTFHFLVYCGYPVTTDSSGTFTAYLAPGDYVFDAGAPGFGNASFPLAVNGFETVSMGEVGLLEDGGLTGTVLSAADHAPVVGALVTLCPNTEGDDCSAPVYSTPTGGYLALGGPGAASLLVQATGFEDDQVAVSVTAATILPGPEFLLQPAVPGQSYTVGGMVTDAETGNPIAAAVIIAVGPSPQPISTASASNGSYELGLTNGTWTISVIAPSHATLSESFDVRGFSVRDLNFSLGPFTLPVEGTVIDGLTDRAVANAELLLAGASLTTTDSTGEFTAQLPNGTYIVELAGPEGTGVPYAARNVTIAVDGRPVDLPQLVLTPVEALVTVTVIGGLDSLGIPGATVRTNGSVPDGYAWGTTASTDSLGRIQTDLPVGTYGIVVSAPGYSSVDEQIQIGSAAPREINVTLELGGVVGPPSTSSPWLAYGVVAAIAAAVAIAAVLSYRRKAEPPQVDILEPPSPSRAIPLHGYQGYGDHAAPSIIDAEVVQTGEDEPTEDG
ncbi:MAG: carboxypeptidase-like regulatory domain-containing protein, partial [Thermoplasmata archaeon]|nr:carboxypeptidase-like regulatory domain-containing protein [Thermoplasmata archaeon]